MFARTSLSESVEVIFKDHLISNISIIITRSITTAMSVALWIIVLAELYTQCLILCCIIFLYYF